MENANNISGFSTNYNLSPLQKTILILGRLNQTDGNLKQIATEFDNDEQLARRFLKLMQDMNWVKKDNRQLWVITEKGDVWLREIEDVLEFR